MPPANRLKQVKRKAPKTAWKPGQSGNPKGRPREVAHVRDLARSHTEAAINALVSIIQSADQSSTARIKAAEVLLNRAWGAPGQFEQEFISAKEELSLEEREMIAKKIEKYSKILSWEATPLTDEEIASLSQNQ